MRNELQRHKRSDKVKWVLTGIMFFLAFIMIAGLILQVFGTGKVKPSEWFKKSDSEQTEQLSDEGGENATAHTRVKSMAATLSAESDISAQNTVDYNTLVGDRATIYVTDSGEFDSGSFTSSNGLIESLPMKSLSGDISVKEVKMVMYGAFASGPDSWSNASITVDDNYYSIIYAKSISGGAVNAPNSDGKVGIVISTNIQLSLSAFASYRSNGLLTAVKLFGLSPTYIYKNKVVYLVSYSDLVSAANAAKSNNQPALLFEYTRAASLPADPVKEGHTFVGWYYDSAFTRPYNGEPIYYDTVLYAYFRIHKFTVTFDSDGGSSVASQTVNWNTTATLTTPTRDKYAFTGWYLPDGTQYTNQPIKEDTTLTAHWERNVFNVTFDTDGGPSVENMEVTLNSSVKLPTVTKTGYIFKGWFLSDGTEYTNQPVTDDISLTAHWEIQTFTVTFYVDGEVYTTKTVEYGQGLAKVAETANLKMLSVRMASGAPITDESGEVLVTEDCAVEAQEMSNTDKVINIIKDNKWAIIGGVAGGVALIVIIAAVCGGAKRKRRR